MGLPAAREEKKQAVPTLQAVFCDNYESVIKPLKLPVFMLRAVDAVMRCRTAAMGGHREYCPGNHFERHFYNSCKHRACPQCSHLPRERWLIKVTARLLACDHFHVIFTIPPKLHGLWRYNREAMADLLFRCVRDVLFTLLKDDRYGGYRPGIIASLHTWGRSLNFHPHLHTLVTAVGLALMGGVGAAKKEDLLPYKVVRLLYRGKMIAMIRRGIERGELKLPPSMPRHRLEEALKSLAEESWNVEIRKRYSHGRGVLTYLSRYVRGGAMSNSRLISADSGHVLFSYRDHRTHERKEMRLPTVSFIRRWLEHVPPPRMKAIRYYGLYEEHQGALLEECRHHLGQSAAQRPSMPSWQEFMAKKGVSPSNVCPVCQRRLLLGPRIPPWRAHHPGVMSGEAA